MLDAGMIHPRLGLTVLQLGFDVVHRSIFGCRKHPNPSVVIAANESVRADLIVYVNEIEIGLWCPVQCYAQIPWKNLPGRTVVKLNDVAFTMTSDSHTLSALASSDLRKINADTRSCFSFVCPEEIKSKT